MSFTTAQRELYWNVVVYHGLQIVAGVYQYADLLHVTDIAYELSLCMVFERPDGDVQWQPALLMRELPHRLIVLDLQDDSPFPTPVPGDIVKYTYVFHSPECASPGDPHSPDSM